jgi:hypothetical protein
MGLRAIYRNESQAFVTPAQAGVHVNRSGWIPAFAGMTCLSKEPSGESRRENKPLARLLVVPIRSGLLGMTGQRAFPAPCWGPYPSQSRPPAPSRCNLTPETPNLRFVLD